MRNVSVLISFLMITLLLCGVAHADAPKPMKFSHEDAMTLDAAIMHEREIVKERNEKLAPYEKKISEIFKKYQIDPDLVQKGLIQWNLETGEIRRLPDAAAQVAPPPSRNDATEAKKKKEK